jgi:hypothetical protein
LETASPTMAPICTTRASVTNFQNVFVTYLSRTFIK